MKMPLQQLWRDKGNIQASRGRRLDREEIANLVRAAPPQFVVANVGEKLRWIPPDETLRFWKDEVKLHLADPGSRPVLDDFPGSYFYFATVWDHADQPPIVLLERHH